MGYYLKCIDQLMKEYDRVESPNKVMLVNTCGWVDGLGADIQMSTVEKVKPAIVVTMSKHNQGLKGNDFTQRCRDIYQELDYLDVVNNPIEGSTNVKGAV